MTNAQQLIEQAREREERIATVWAARERCQQVIRLAEATTTVGKTPVGWCTKREAQHLMNAPSVGGSGGIFVGIGEFDFFPSWGCWNYPGTAIRTACRAGLTKTRYRRLWPEKKGTAQEYIAAYDANPMTHCETCRKKAVWYDREKERFLADETERLAAEVSAEV
jgi:hypothetical protein